MNLADGVEQTAECGFTSSDRQANRRAFWECVNRFNPLGAAGVALLSLPGALIDKRLIAITGLRVVGISGSSASNVSTIPSALALHIYGSDARKNVFGNFLRESGKLASPLWLSYAGMQLGTQAFYSIGN